MVLGVSPSLLLGQGLVPPAQLHGDAFALPPAGNIGGRPLLPSGPGPVHLLPSLGLPLPSCLGSPPPHRSQTNSVYSKVSPKTPALPYPCSTYLLLTVCQAVCPTLGIKQRRKETRLLPSEGFQSRGELDTELKERDGGESGEETDFLGQEIQAIRTPRNRKKLWWLPNFLPQRSVLISHLEAKFKIALYTPLGK